VVERRGRAGEELTLSTSTAQVSAKGRGALITGKPFDGRGRPVVGSGLAEVIVVMAAGIHRGRAGWCVNEWFGWEMKLKWDAWEEAVGKESK
jgi:hypothetical protein